MARKHPPFTPEFRRQMIELVRSGRSPESLANEFEPTAQTIRNWVAQGGAMRASVTMARRRRIAKRSGACGVRTVSSKWSATFSQKPRPGSLGRRM